MYSHHFIFLLASVPGNFHFPSEYPQMENVVIMQSVIQIMRHNARITICWQLTAVLLNISYKMKHFVKWSNSRPSVLGRGNE